MNVLIVEDDITTTLVLTRALQERSHAVVACSSAEQAMELYTPDRFPLIILDLMLPGMNGLAICHWIRQQPHGDMPYILISTAKSETSDLMDALAAGANDYLQKSMLADGFPVRLAVAEQAIRELNRRRNAEDIALNILRTAPDGFWMLDTHGNILNSNESLWRILHRSRCDLEGCHHSQVIHTEDRALAQKHFQETVIGGEARFSCRGIRPDGSPVDLEISSKFIDQQGGRIVAFLKDVTERKKAEERLRQAQKMDSIGRLASGIAHDFNNLLTVIQGRAALLGMTVTGPDIESVQEIESAAGVGGSLTRQLLTFSRQRPAELKPMDLNSIILAFQRMVRRILGEEIEYRTELARGIPLVQADQGMIEQLLLNFAGNARDAIEGKGRFTVQTFARDFPAPPPSGGNPRKAGTYVCLVAEDSGTGIQPEAISHIFEPFFTTKQPGKGTGIGLAVVYGIVEQHGGWIEVQSEPGAGTRFTVHLPGTAAPSHSLPSRTTPLSFNFERGSRSERVLLVEDDPGVASLANCVLTLQGFEVYTADSGPTALEVWDRQGGRFDLLLTDVMMPGGMNGLDVAEALKLKDPKLKVLYMSGYNPEIVRLGGSSNFLAKPCHPGTLADAVKRALAGGLPH